MKRCTWLLLAGLMVWLAAAGTATASGPIGNAPGPAGALVGQSNTQSSKCNAGGNVSGSCNNTQTATNTANATSGGGAVTKFVAPPPGYVTGGSGDAVITQSNTQSSKCYAGGNVDGSCNNTQTATNQANAATGSNGPTAAAPITRSIPGPSQNAGDAVIHQTNSETSSCHAGGNIAGSCNNTQTVANQANATSGGAASAAGLTSF